MHSASENNIYRSWKTHKHSTKKIKQTAYAAPLQTNLCLIGGSHSMEYEQWAPWLKLLFGCYPVILDTRVWLVFIWHASSSQFLHATLPQCVIHLSFKLSCYTSISKPLYWNSTTSSKSSLSVPSLSNFTVFGMWGKVTIFTGYPFMLLVLSGKRMVPF